MGQRKDYKKLTKEFKEEYMDLTDDNMMAYKKTIMTQKKGIKNIMG